MTYNDVALPYVVLDIRILRIVHRICHTCSAIFPHVASDIGIGQLFLPPENCQTQINIDSISKWTEENLMQINELKSYYLVFTRSKRDFATRFTINNKYLERLGTFIF